MGLVISGVIDGPLTGGVPKAIELFVTADIPDLSIYGLGSANNGGGSDGEEFTFPTGAVAAGTYLYVASDTNGFTNFFGFAPDYVDSAALINGDDAIELFENGSVIDVFGEIDVDGTGQPWEYMDGWAYRVPGTGPDGTTFNPANWTFSDPNALDGETSNGTAATPFPIGTFGDGPTDPDIAINELRISSPGGSDDTSNFVELSGTPDASLDDLTLVVISGEFEPGRIDFAFDLTGAATDADGFFLLGNDGSGYSFDPGDIVRTGTDRFDFFGSPSTFLLVEGFTGAAGDDLDSDNDGDIDSPPWTSIVDGVSLIDGDGNPDFNYADTVVGPSGTFPPAGVARIPDGSGDFVQLAFDDTAADTPGATNQPEQAATPARIYEIQGAGHVSPFVTLDLADLPPDTLSVTGERVATGGIVTALESNGFYVQDAEGDGDIATSDAVFVFTGSAPSVSVGDLVDIEATVAEFFPGDTDTRNLPTTQLTAAEVTVVSSGNDLPASVILGQGGRVPPSEVIDDDAFGSFDPTTDGIDFFESLEGMLVTAANPVAIAPTSRFDEIFVAVDEGDGATGLSDRGTLNISPDDFNPEKIQIDFDSGVLPGIVTPDVGVGTKFADITGVISYDFGNYQINPTEQVVVVEASTLEPETSDLVGSANELTIATYNVLNLDPVVEDVNNVDDRDPGDVDDDVGNGRFKAIAEQIVNNLNAPDIIALQEIQDNTGAEITDGITSASDTLQLLIDEIDLADDGLANGSLNYQFIDNTFIGDDVSGGQPGGNIRTAFLYDADRVDLVPDSVRPVGDQSPGSAFNGARLPLAATFAFNGEEVTVVNNHFSSKGGSAPILGVEQPFDQRQEDVTVNGSLDERQAQAAEVKAFVDGILADDPDANVVVAGDLNEFEFVSPVETLADSLTNLTDAIPEDERYSFIFQGNSQQLDHILVSDSLAGDAAVDIVHVNTEFAELPTRASDHDPVLARLTIGEAPVETVEVAVDFSRIFLGTRATQSVDGEEVDSDALRFPRDSLRLSEIDVRVKAVDPTDGEALNFFGGSVGVWSFDDGLFGSDTRLVDGDESLVFKLYGREFGDGLAASFSFDRVKGDGDVMLRFYDDGALVDELMLDASDKSIEVDLQGDRFDEVELSVLGNTQLSLDGFAFDREDEDQLLV